MPFTKQQADKLIQNIDVIFAGGKTAEAIDQLKAVLMKTNTCGDGEAEMARVGLHLKERLKHSPDKAWSPISRLIHIHTVADISAKDKNGRTLLQCALQLNDHDALKLLTQTYGANVDTAQDEEGNARLHLAVKAGDLKKTQTLVDAAWADVNIKNKQGATPLHIAAEEGHLKIIEFLVERKAKVDALDEHSNTPLSSSRKKGSCRCAEYVAVVRRGPKCYQYRGQYRFAFRGDEWP